jgi:DNA recombination protein RmuC
MFIPIESALAAAFIANPELHEHALRSKVIVASSGTFLGLLQTVGLFWRQEQLAENARAICEAGTNLYERLARFAIHIDKMGDALGNATKRFNAAVGSFESRVLPAAKTLKSLKVSSSVELEPPVQVEIIPRRMTADETAANIES